MFIWNVILWIRVKYKVNLFIIDFKFIWIINLIDIVWLKYIKIIFDLVMKLNLFYKIIIKNVLYVKIKCNIVRYKMYCLKIILVKWNRILWFYYKYKEVFFCYIKNYGMLFLKKNNVFLG